MSTMQDVIDLARIPLNDSAKVRYLDADLLKSANAAISAAYKVRPDLRYGSFGTEFSALAVGGTFPLPYQFEQVVADYMTARAEMKNDDSVNSGRAVLLMQTFEKEVMTL